MKTKENIVYKLVRVDEGKLFSSIMYKSPWVIEYKVGKVVYPRVSNSKLFAFKTIEQASDWLDGGPKKIYRAEATEISMSGGLPFYTDLDKFGRFWDNGIGALDESFSPPFGTVACSSLKLLEEAGV